MKAFRSLSVLLLSVLAFAVLAPPGRAQTVKLRETWVVNNLVDIGGTIFFSEVFSGKELNPIMAPFVNKKKTLQFVVAAGIGMYVFDRIGQSIKEKSDRDIWYGLGAAVEFLAVTHNFIEFGGFRRGYPFIPLVVFSLPSKNSRAPLVELSASRGMIGLGLRF